MSGPVGPRPAVAIVVMGAAVRPDGAPSPVLRRRVAAAAAFGARQPAPPLYLVTGAAGRHGPPESTVMAGLLRDHGVAGGRIVEEPTGTDTLSSVLACARLLRGMGHAGPVRVATSGYHLPRCVALFRLAGVAARPAPPPALPPGHPWTARWRWRLREGAALPWDAGLMLWHRLRGRAARPR